MNRLIFLFVLTLFCRDVFSQSCRTPLGGRSRCISLYDCPEILRALQSYLPSPPPEPVSKFIGRSHCGFVGGALDKPKVCCGPVPEFAKVEPLDQMLRNEVDLDPVSSEDSSPATSNCGIDSTDRIFGGEATDLGEFPWMALLGYKKERFPINYQCGGALINHRYVITAAHCIVGRIAKVIGKLTTVRLGEYNKTSNPDCIGNMCAKPIQEIPVHLAIQPGYEGNTRSRRNDIGLVRLARRAEYSYYVKPICMTSLNTQLNVDDTLYTAGWGLTERSNRNSEVKLKVDLNVYDKEACVRKYQEINVNVWEKQLCAGGEFSKDSCKGDSGSPLMKRKPNGVWEIVGVVSFGNGCGKDGWPAVYSKVASYLDWIQETVTSTNV